MRKLTSILLLSLSTVICSCGGSSIPTNPVKDMSTEFESKYAYSILLKDMDLKDGQYLHKYTVVDIEQSSEISISTTDWKKVDDNFFYLHEDDLGMELLSKKPDGKLNNLVTPPGFTNFINNDHYGSWTGSSIAFEVWTFNSQHAQLESELGLKGLSISHDEYKEYQGKYLNNRPYYGPKTGTSDSTKYGTRSSHWFIMYPMFYTRRTHTKNFSKPRSIFNTNGNRGGGGFGK